MANAMYPKYRQAQLEGSASRVVALTDDIVVIAVDSGYTFDDAHEFMDDVSGGTVVATSDPLTGKDTTDGVFDADDLTLVGVTGDDIEGLIFAKDTGTPSTSRLMIFLDTKSNASPIDITPTGDDIIITWSNGSTKIFRL